MSSYEYCDFFKNTYFEEHLQTAASAVRKLKQPWGFNQASQIFSAIFSKLFQNISQHSKDSNHDRVLFNWICGLWSWHFTAFSGDFLCEFSQIFLEKLFFGTNPDESSIPIPRWSIQEQPPEVFYKKGALKNFTKSTGKHLCQSLFFNKVAVLRPATLLKKDSGAGVFLWILWNF